MRRRRPAAAPGAPRLGPGPIPPAVVRALDVELVRRVRELWPGERPAVGAGAGTELQRVRPYVAGDDVRHLDAAATARTGEPHVRVHVAERALTTWLVLDRSASMGFGTADRAKADVAEGVATVLATLATRRGNRLGVVAFGAGAPSGRRPTAGRPGLLGALAEARGAVGPEGVAGSLADALHRAGRLARGRGLVVVVSDWRGERAGDDDAAWLAPLRRLRARHALLAVEVRDPREQELPDVGADLALVDPETGRHLRVDTRSGRLRARFAQAAAEERARVASDLRSAGAHHVVLSTRGEWLLPLAAALRARGVA